MEQQLYKDLLHMYKHGQRTDQALVETIKDSLRQRFEEEFSFFQLFYSPREACGGDTIHICLLDDQDEELARYTIEPPDFILQKC